MIAKEIKERYSCKRKSDFVTYFAIGFYVLIIIFEFYLVFGIPLQLRREGVLQKHVVKEEMVKLVDYQRGLLKYVPVQNATNKNEVALVNNMLDLYASYIRQYQDILSLQDMLEINDLLKRYGVLISTWQDKQFVFKREEIPLIKTMELLEKKHDL